MSVVPSPPSTTPVPVPSAPSTSAPAASASPGSASSPGGAGGPAGPPARSYTEVLASAVDTDDAVELLDLLVALGDDPAVRALWDRHGPTLAESGDASRIMVDCGRAWTRKLWADHTVDAEALAQVAVSESRTTVLQAIAGNAATPAATRAALACGPDVQAAAEALVGGRVDPATAGRAAGPLLDHLDALSFQRRTAVVASAARSWAHRLQLPPGSRRIPEPFSVLARTGSVEDVAADLVERAEDSTAAVVADMVDLRSGDPDRFPAVQRRLLDAAVAVDGPTVPVMACIASFAQLRAADVDCPVELARAATSSAHAALVADLVVAKGVRESSWARMVATALTDRTKDGAAFPLDRPAAAGLAAVLVDRLVAAGLDVAATAVLDTFRIGVDLLFSACAASSRRQLRAAFARLRVNVDGDAGGVKVDLSDAALRDRGAAVRVLLAEAAGDPQVFANLVTIATRPGAVTINDVVAVRRVIT